MTHDTHLDLNLVRFFCCCTCFGQKVKAPNCVLCSWTRKSIKKSFSFSSRFFHLVQYLKFVVSMAEFAYLIWKVIKSRKMDAFRYFKFDYVNWGKVFRCECIVTFSLISFIYSGWTWAYVYLVDSIQMFINWFFGQ